jgi:hypothetical protein
LFASARSTRRRLPSAEPPQFERREAITLGRRSIAQSVEQTNMENTPIEEKKSIPENVVAPVPVA